MTRLLPIIALLWVMPELLLKHLRLKARVASLPNFHPFELR